MNPKKRRIVILARIGFIALVAHLASCSGVRRVATNEQPTDRRPALPPITVERLEQCVADYAHELAPATYLFRPKVQVDRDGYIVNVDAGQIPNTAPDLAACTREAMWAMTIPTAVFNLRPTQAAASPIEPTVEQRTHLGAAPAIVIVIVGLGEAIFEMGAYTVLFAVSVELVDKASKDIAEALKRKRNKWRDECAQKYAECMATHVADENGNTWKQSRCGICAASCDTNKLWPSHVGNGSCEYWKRGWGLQ